MVHRPKAGVMAHKISENLDVRVYRRVMDAILEGRLRPGSKLNEEELADIFNVSRSIIRKTLTRLAHDGVVVARKNRGTSIAIFSTNEAKDIFAARRVVESAITRFACERYQREHSSYLLQLIDDELDAQSSGDHGKALRISSEFHFKIAEISENKPLADFSRTLVSRCSLIVAQFDRPGTPLCNLQHEHRDIVSALESGDCTRAEALMSEHVLHIENNIDLSGGSTEDDLSIVFANK